jgi:hypothetical protein
LETSLRRSLACLAIVGLTVAACSRSNGVYQALVVVVNEPPGVRCVNGGRVIEAGLDLNRDGVLEPNEINFRRI